MAQLRYELGQDEGERLRLYSDTRGLSTIGIGRNLSGKGIRTSEMEAMFANDVQDAAADLDAHAPWWRQLDPVRQRAMLNLCFNMGWGTLATFHHFLAAMQAHQWSAAVAELRASRWWSEVGERGPRIAGMIGAGVRAVQPAQPAAQVVA